jgi:SP family general alpha glucoside:H+ symporter-like MFS transporter
VLIRVTTDLDDEEQSNRTQLVHETEGLLRQQERREPFTAHAENRISENSEQSHVTIPKDNPRDGTDLEHDLQPWEAIKAYPWAIFWSLMVSMCVVMEGYDTILIGNFYAFPAFQRKFGTYFVTIDGYQIPAAWQAALSNAAGVGSFIGVLITGFLVDSLGQKRVLLGSLMLLSVFVAMTFTASRIEVLFLGEFLCGFPWGAFATTAPAYASEVLPLALRVYLTSYTNMCFIIGQLIAAATLAGLVGWDSEWAFRIPFAVQWIWPAFLLPTLCFAPESPWHLVRKGRIDEAEASLNRLKSKKARVNAQQTLETILHTKSLEEELQVGTSYADCFRGTERRRTEIACLVFAGQVLSGSSFAYNATYLFEQVGLPTETTYNLNLGGTALALVGTLCSWFFFMPYFGRRTIYLGGMFTMAAILFIIGFLNIRSDVRGVGLSQAILTLVWTFTFQLSVGQLGWAIPSEVGSTRLRQKTICLARNSYYVVSVIAQILNPYMVNPTQWDLKGYTGFVWGGTALLISTWAFFRLPETKSRSYEELDILFAQKVPARQFSSYRPELLGDIEMRTSDA